MKPLKEIRFKPRLETITSVFEKTSKGQEVLAHILQFKTVHEIALHDARMVKLLNKSLELLRRVYNDIEMNHLTDTSSLLHYFVDPLFHKNLGEDIFNFLQSQDEVFRQTTMRRQQRWRRRNRRK